MTELPTYTSYSSLSSYAKCPKAWQLQRLVKVPQSQGWARLGGSAVHVAAERYDTGVSGSAQELFDQAFMEEIWEAYLKDPDIDSWAASKKGTEGQAFWWKNGPTYVQRWIDWTKEYSHWRLATLSDGRSGVELEFKPTIGGREVRMFIDRLYVLENGDVIVVDLKTGTWDADLLQAGLYAEGVYQETGIRPIWGAFWYARKGFDPRKHVKNLEGFTPHWLGSIVEGFFRDIEAGNFPAKQTALCNSCSVRKACAAVGGAQAEQYDPDFRATGVAA